MAEESKSLQELGAITGAPPVGIDLVMKPVHVQKHDKFGRAYATGKRKNAVARVWIKPGRGKITVNTKDFSAYFARPVLQIGRFTPDIPDETVCLQEGSQLGIAVQRRMQAIDK